jgi:predicted Zn-dependent protease
LRILTDCGGTGHDVAAADAALVRACELDPHLPWNWLERARLARVVGEYEAAIALVFRALKEEPNTVRGWLLLARLEAEYGRMDAAHRARAEAERRSELASRSGLTEYERELLAFPGGQWSIPPEIPQGDSSEGR